MSFCLFFFFLVFFLVFSLLLFNHRNILSSFLTYLSPITGGSCMLQASCLSRQNTSFVTTNYHWRELPQVSFLSRQIFVATNRYLSRQKFLKAKSFFRDKSTLVATKVRLSRQKYVCRDKTFVATNISREKTVVATKMILVTALVNDRL